MTFSSTCSHRPARPRSPSAFRSAVALAAAIIAASLAAPLSASPAEAAEPDGGLAAARCAPGHLLPVAGHRPCEVDRGAEWRWQVGAMGGLRGGLDGHGFVGAGASALHGRLGGAGVAQLGRGSGYRSTLLGAGPALGLLRTERSGALAWIGPGWYAETLDAGPERSLVVGLVGLTVVREMGPGVVGLHATALLGRLDAEGFEQRAPARGVRLALSLGLGGGR